MDALAAWGLPLAACALACLAAACRVATSCLPASGGAREAAVPDDAVAAPAPRRRPRRPEKGGDALAAWVKPATPHLRGDGIALLA